MHRILVIAPLQASAQAGRRGRSLRSMKQTFAPPEPDNDLLALDQALTRLEQEHPSLAELVKLRYFAGLTMPQAADALGISLRTAVRNWTYARRGSCRPSPATARLPPPSRLTRSRRRGCLGVDSRFTVASGYRLNKGSLRKKTLEKLWRGWSSFTHLRGEAMVIAQFGGADAVDEQSIFLTALEKGSVNERRTWLTEACGTDTRLRQRIESLLAKHDDAGSFLEKPPSELGLENTQALAGADTRNEARGDGLGVALDFLRPPGRAGVARANRTLRGPLRHRPGWDGDRPESPRYQLKSDRSCKGPGAGVGRQCDRAEAVRARGPSCRGSQASSRGDHSCCR